MGKEVGIGREWDGNGNWRRMGRREGNGEIEYW
jgi:hypothetical protein